MFVEAVAALFQVLWVWSQCAYVRSSFRLEQGIPQSLNQTDSVNVTVVLISFLQ